jgi:hypothetical protein
MCPTGLSGSRSLPVLLERAGPHLPDGTKNQQAQSIPCESRRLKQQGVTEKGESQQVRSDRRASW